MKSSHAVSSIGDSLTVSLPASERERRQALWDASGALVVEMENYWVARAAARSGVRFLSVRAISDGVEDVLPDFAQFTTPAGDILWRRAGAYFLAHPPALGNAARLFKGYRAARRSLADFFYACLPILVREVAH
jgi:hypothetical protein